MRKNGLLYFSDHPEFTPAYTPAQMHKMGVLAGVYDERPASANYYGVYASMSAWRESWFHKSAPKGWWEWYQKFYAGRRTEDDSRQIKRWRGVVTRHTGLMLQRAALKDEKKALANRQALLHWAWDSTRIPPGWTAEDVRVRDRARRERMKE